MAEDLKPKQRKRRAPSRRLVFAAAGLLVVALVLIAAFGLWRASTAGRAGRAQLAKAEQDLLAQRIEPTRQDLLLADVHFRQMQRDLHGLGTGTVLAIGRLVPFVRVQIRSIDIFAEIGESLSHAGIDMANAAAAIEKPTGQAVPLSASLGKLRTAQTSLQGGIKVLNHVTSQMEALNGYRLLGPLDHAHRDALQRLHRIDASAKSAEQAVTALIAFTGGNGPRQYLVLSQNPDELRPTGGFAGSYGVLVADTGRIHLDRYDDSITWVMAHPTAVIPAAQLASPFRFYDPPLDQTLANVNAVPDWPHTAQVALKLWQLGGEAPADGLVSFTPQFLARVLAVTGPVAVPSYNETITSANVISKLDYYTHVAMPQPGENRKQFLSPLGQAVMARLLEAPPSQWRGLGTAVAKAFSLRELLVWSRDQAVQSTLTGRSWDGVLPSIDGDFFFDGEFEYGAKNGRGLKRVFDDQVVLRPDGSAQVTTTITINNTEGPSPQNDSPLTYFTLYGPAGATLDWESSDPPFSPEPAIGEHPAGGWFRTIGPNSSGTIKVVWFAPALAQVRSDGTWQYSLNWQHIVDNTGDVLNLTVKLPTGARWGAAPPPPHSSLDHDVIGTWTYRLGG